MITSHRGGSGSSGSSSPVIEISAIHTKLNDLNHIYDKFGIRADISIYYKYYTSDICKKKWKLDIGKVKFFIQFIKMMFIYLIVNNVGPNVLKTLKHISPWFANITVMKNTDVAVTHYRRMTAKSATDCCAACAADPKCKVAVFHVDHCNLKDELRLVPSNADFVTVIPGRSPSPTPTPTPTPTPSPPPSPYPPVSRTPRGCGVAI